jgi:hypothetical protein
MRTLALHTLGSHTARNMTVRPLQTRETADRPALTYTHMSAFQTFSVSTPDASPGHHIALRLRGRLYTPSRPPYSTHYTVDVTLECQTVVLRTDDFWPANTRVRRGRAQNDATAQCDGLWGQSRRLGISPSHGASVAPRSAELRPRGPPPAASARPTAAAPDDPIDARSRGARGSPPTPIRVASGPPPGGYQHLRLAARP